MPSLPFRVTQVGISTDVGFTSMFAPDYMIRPFNIGVGCVVNGAQTYTVEHTFDYTGSSVFISSNATWFPNTGITAQTTNKDGNYAYPVTGIRLNVTAGSSTGTVSMTLVSAG